MELRRKDIGFGRVIVDDHGVTRRGIMRTHALAWPEIADYRLTIEVRGHAPDVLDLASSLIQTVRIVGDAVRAARGDSQIDLAIDLIGATDTVELDAVRFRDANAAIGEIVAKLHPRLLAAARAELADRGVVRFGELALAADQIAWGDREPLAAAAVESVELFDSSPVRLRVMAKGKALPYGQAPTVEIPNLGAALVLARELGYPAQVPSLFAR